MKRAPLIRARLRTVLRPSTPWTAAFLVVSLVRAAALTFGRMTWGGGGPLSDWTVATLCTVDSDT